MLLFRLGLLVIAFQMLEKIIAKFTYKTWVNWLNFLLKFYVFLVLLCNTKIKNIQDNI